jgi:hypothetical protein
MHLTAIDFEASCLPRAGRSFPIEVGIADERGARSWLIRPRIEWAEWGWTAEAERLHGIDRAMLDRTGLPADQVAAELADAVCGRQLLADSVLDEQWLGVLLGSPAGRSPRLPIVQIGTILAALHTPDAEIEASCAALAMQPFRRHRAGDDARWLYGFVTSLQQSAAARMDHRDGRVLFGWDDASVRDGALAPNDG